MKSILSSRRECFFCHTPYNLHKHHIYEGRNRQRSEDNGFWVYLCANHHTMGPQAVHQNTEVNTNLKKLCQRAYEQNHTREEFMELIGINYLWEDEE